MSAVQIEESQSSLHSTRDWLPKFDNRIHLPLHGIIKHTQKAAVAIFSDTSMGIKQAIHSDPWTKRTYSIVGGLLLGLGEGRGHLCVSCLSFYGEVTDMLDFASSYYDPYREGH